MSYFVPFPEKICREEAPAGGQFSATHRRLAFQGAYWVCRPSFAFTHANPRGKFSFGYSGTGETWHCPTSRW